MTKTKFHAHEPFIGLTFLFLLRATNFFARDNGEIRRLLALGCSPEIWALKAADSRERNTKKGSCSKYSPIRQSKEMVPTF